MDNLKDIEELFRLYYRPLCLFATHLLKDTNLVEDVVMDCYVKLWDKMKEEEILSPKNYLYMTVRHSCYDKNVAISTMTSFEEAISDLADEEDHLEELSMIEARLWTAIDTLPTKCRQIFLMSKRDNMTYQEIADELHLSVKTVEAQIGKAYKRLRETGRNIYHFFLSFF